MDLRQLEAVVAVARFGSFAAAAVHLCITQPAISTRVSNLEKQIGYRIFLRSNHKVVTTPKGSEFLRQANKVIMEVNALLGSQSHFHNADSGVMARIGATSSFVKGPLTKILKRVMLSHSQINFDVSIGDSSYIWSLLLSGKLDVGFLANPMPHHEIQCARLFASKLIFIKSPNLSLSVQMDTLSAICQHKIFVSSQGSFSHALVQQIMHERELPVNLCPVASVESIVELTEAGLGVGVATRLAASDNLLAGSLQEIPDLDLGNLQYCACYRVDGLLGVGALISQLSVRAWAKTDERVSG